MASAICMVEALPPKSGTTAGVCSVLTTAASIAVPASMHLLSLYFSQPIEHHFR